MMMLSISKLIVSMFVCNTVLCDSSKPLLLTPMLCRGDISTARDYSRVQDQDGVIPTSYSGFITVDKLIGNHLFFWFFPAMNSDPKAPLIIWLNGGPGVPSELGLFYENGPFKFRETENGEVGYERKNNSWAETFSMLYIDNPIGVGFSYSDNGEEGYRTTQEEYTRDLYEFIQQFYVMFPEYLQRELYIGGQSYAGKYVPAFAYRIHEEIQVNRTKIPLTGIYLGGPLIDLEVQGPMQADLFYSLGFISAKQRQDYEISSKRAILEFVSGQKKFVPDKDFEKVSMNMVCNGCWDNLHNLENVPYQSVGNVMRSLRLKVHAGSVPFEETNYSVHVKLGSDYFVSTTAKFTKLMDSYKVLVFVGSDDGVISSPSVEALLTSIPWSLQSEYNDAKKLVWFDQDTYKVKGFYTHVGQFCRVTVLGAGHQVPHDQPESTLLMMTEFIKNGCISGN
ncbi:probable serine carboxypeptidase CPVL [Biomphalaria glabrata]|uniref:Probable serine carboxypeptidase CPVL n=1 Tax=Biomphalaria glabrata TaxID=6526 RepID=A0A9W2YCN9_BIOGL|nr:probable serine carboxypeptidase CPVL [Biomphalaria glabrata]XP_055860520.1 probable serine carboxypeptidase CPVL [Biomphalaria glabrata]XP_055860521.1 probable serine carboxypeptidase CPVL [Biomphalaria glabrata]XP_055860522.1 probable serine carboxypeptidase CPVL [Biomphalaria glabrata]XP_055860523.1 probable serine carboxypeptidase CPVL [Biomphalaria glabrata]